LRRTRLAETARDASPQFKYEIGTDDLIAAVCDARLGGLWKDRAGMHRSWYGLSDFAQAARPTAMPPACWATLLIPVEIKRGDGRGCRNDLAHEQPLLGTQMSTTAS
jgi:hypothetical protein